MTYSHWKELKKVMKIYFDFPQIRFTPKATPATNKADNPPSIGTSGQGPHPEQNGAGGGLAEQHDIKLTH